MENNILANEVEVIDVANNVGNWGTKEKLIVYGAAAVAGSLTYLFVVRPLIKRFRNKKQQVTHDNVIHADFTEYDDNEEAL